MQIVCFIFRFHCAAIGHATVAAAVEFVAPTVSCVCPSLTMACRIAKYTPDMKREDVEKAFSSALKMWSDATPLQFIKVNHGKADIVLSFARRSKSEKHF